MRSFTDFNQARNEIRRDLNELGQTVFAGYQSMEVTDEQREALTTKELVNYDYVVIQPNPEHLDPVQPWASAEWQERLWGINNRPVNPGEAWKLRPGVWTPLLEEDGRFSYTYSQRLAQAYPKGLLQALRINPESRQVYLGIWDPVADGLRLGKRRVPCSLGYHILVRRGRVEIIYTMRSNDFATHWDNDCWMALQIQRWFAEGMELPTGPFVHCVGSLHVYASEVAGVF